MYSAIEVAKYVINRSQEIDSPVSNLKLQKILFYIQAAMLVKLKKPCFRDEIIAWTYGPVIKEVYDKFKIYGRDMIPFQEQTRDMEFDYNRIEIKFEVSKTNINVEEKEIINQVIDAYSKIQNPFVLVEKTHSEEPWKKTEIGKEIQIDLIESYYSKHPEKIYNR